MTTARSIIIGALKDIQVIASEEPIQASMAEDALDLLNGLIESLSLDNLWIYYTPPTPISWPAGRQSLTWGVPGGDIPTPRPIRLQSYASYQIPGQEVWYGLTVLERQDEYDMLAFPTLQSTIPSVLYYAPSMPLGTLFLWPVPESGVTILVYPWQVLGAFPSLDAELDFPPGYVRALRLALAIEAAPSYGVQPSPLILRNAEHARMQLQTVNTVVGRLSLTPGAGASQWGGIGLPPAFYSGRW